MQTRLIDERVCYCLEDEIKFEVLNYDEVVIEERGGILSCGKGMRNWEVFEETGVDKRLTDKETKEDFIEEIKEGFEIKESQIIWISREKSEELGYKEKKLEVIKLI